MRVGCVISGFDPYTLHNLVCYPVLIHMATALILGVHSYDPQQSLPDAYSHVDVVFISAAVAQCHASMFCVADGYDKSPFEDWLDNLVV